MSAKLLGCQYCGQINDITEIAETQSSKCSSCDSHLIGPRSTNRKITFALSVAALALYVPANIYPILKLNQLGMYSENTILSGVVSLADHGFWGIAIIVFIASILVPILKIMGLLYLSLPPEAGTLKLRIRLLRILHVIGPWSMLDVFVVAILISLVKLGDLANMTTGPGLVAFTGVVVLTMVASYHFDARHDWLGKQT